MIPATHFRDNGDGTAWWVLTAFENWIINDDRDRVCGTCGGHGYHYPEETGVPTGCDCLHGRHTFDVEVEASGCEHKYTDHTGGNYTAMERCRDCKASRDGYGFSPWIKQRRVSIIPGMILPIIANSNDWEHGVTNHIDLMGSTVILRTNTDGFEQDHEIITLPSAAAPGMYAVKVIHD